MIKVKILYIYFWEDLVEVTWCWYLFTSGPQWCVYIYDISTKVFYIFILNFPNISKIVYHVIALPFKFTEANLCHHFIKIFIIHRPLFFMYFWEHFTYILFIVRIDIFLVAKPLWDFMMFITLNLCVDSIEENCWRFYMFWEFATYNCFMEFLFELIFIITHKLWYPYEMGVLPTTYIYFI
jgi:hypothetical protein